ncbi:hypothetical protein I6G82_02535 [Lysinibacillus macroides]|uniref:Uncharacterized protein n=1 Tax=Lysinibacillus macroides TaxID=33935 RepID=A0A0M9DI20_9BACI|nr:hypothetical protein [Lysinibacillus macroides]KOY81309.1 hypothetical protein ADM90_19435 [Lysinibacillus macroides]QPR68528.1 hypothetical protein I6G82_02535 [Lysinibacillus macroides]
MKKFDGATDALREVKRLSSEITRYDKIFFAYNKYSEEYYVTTESDELEEEIYRQWCDSGCDSEPESEAEDYKLWEYILAVNKEKYPNTYRDAKKSLIVSENSLIRKDKKIICEYSVSFIIPY